MGKTKETIYQCDKCKEKFFDSEEVFVVDGSLEDGEGELIAKDSMLCPSCLIELAFVDRDILDPIIDISESVQDAIAVKEELDDEDDDDDYVTPFEIENDGFGEE